MYACIGKNNFKIVFTYMYELSRESLALSFVAKIVFKLVSMHV